jgi:pimeloyl-ACP methyl ester carboxylesterase
MRLMESGELIPAWFRDSIAVVPETGKVVVEGAHIEWAAWGSTSRPGLLLLPGSAAHLGWWGFLAPFFAHRHRVATLSWSGTGKSDWRERYASRQFAAEALACAEAAGLFGSGHKPLIVGHSFGGFIAITVAGMVGERLRATVIADSRLTPTARWAIARERERPPRVYASEDHAFKAFRLSPVQPIPNGFIRDWLARDAIVPTADGLGWTWRADPNVRVKTLIENTEDLIARARCPLAFIRGVNSGVTTEEIWNSHRMQAPPHTPFIEIPEAAHHLMIDQPIAVVGVLRSLLATLP